LAARPTEVAVIFSSYQLTEVHPTKDSLRRTMLKDHDGTTGEATL